LAELEWEGRPERPMLRRAIRHRLRRFDPTIRVVAEDFLAEVSPIDLLAVGGEGELISVRIARSGEDTARLTHCLADLTWLSPRLADLLKLAPALGLEPSAAPRAILLSPTFSRETCAAAASLPNRTIELLIYRCIRERGQLSVLLETSVDMSSTRPGFDRNPDSTDSEAADRPSQLESTSTRPTAEATGLVGDRRDPDGFRTGLRDADLRIEDLEEEKVLD
jgi:hypothetical protein